MLAVLGSADIDPKLSGEELRRFVADTLLPSDDEWSRLTADGRTDAVILPHAADRRVTVSVGVTNMAAFNLGERGTRVAQRLLADADTALYRSKSGGRNMVTLFSEILLHHGRILEYHPETDVVVIDIGKQVNVTMGQEFLVFHPQFTGTQSFFHSDGRTRRRLGTYPRRSTGRILAFDVQQEISFCEVTQRPPTGTFATGSALEALPVGAISHLISSEPRLEGDFALVDATALPKLVASFLEKDMKLFAIVVSISNLDDLLTQRGTAFVNRALVRLCATLAESFPPTTKISQLHTTEIALLGDDSEIPVDLTEVLEEALRSAEARCNNLAHFVAGVANRSELENAIPGLRFSSIVDMARYAASKEGRLPNERITPFSRNVGFNVMLSQRKQRRQNDALKDYQALTEIGLVDADIDNLAALCALESRPRLASFAVERLRHANTLRPKNPVFRANLGYALCADGRRLEAYHEFTTIEKLREPNFITYMPHFALSALAAYEADPKGIDFSSVVSLLQEAAALEPRHYREFASQAEIKGALAKLTSSEGDRAAEHAPTELAIVPDGVPHRG